jgi:hypothetical protein
MKKNMGSADRSLRTLLAVLMAVLVMTEIVKGALAYIFVALTAIFLITSILGFCPLYVPFKISTLRQNRS